MPFHVIMPLDSDPNASDKHQIIEKVSIERGLKAFFPSYSKQKPACDFDSTVKELEEAEFVIVDLSLERPSCYYELGLVEMLRKPVHLVAQVNTDIHQTTNRDKVIFFKDLIEFETIIRKILS